MDDRDIGHLRRAIDLAGVARARGDHPFGALVVAADGRVLIEAGNTVSVDGPTGHAESNAVRAVAGVDGAVLRGATLYTSTEPCAMCAGAIYWGGVARVVYALGEDALRSMTGDDPANRHWPCPVARSSPVASGRPSSRVRRWRTRRGRCTAASGAPDGRHWVTAGRRAVWGRRV
jgi:tRNA(Arg) A34 adenosine deaminase TadA